MQVKDLPVMPKKIECYECGKFTYNERTIGSNFYLFKESNGLHTHYLCRDCRYDIIMPKLEKKEDAEEEEEEEEDEE